VTDRRSGRTLNADLAEYRVPVYADVPPMEALMTGEHDPYVSALGIKGVGNRHPRLRRARRLSARAAFQC